MQDLTLTPRQKWLASQHNLLPLLSSYHGMCNLLQHRYDYYIRTAMYQDRLSSNPFII